jgi:hypothetical protein
MPYRDVRELGGFETYGNPELADGLESLEEIRLQRANVAQSAAKHAIEACGGETLDLRLYYAAMFGRSYSEGIYEHDPNLLVPQDIARTLTRSEGQPLLVRAVNYPEHNVDVGLVASFSDEGFEPVKFEVAWGEYNSDDFHSWQGGLAIAMRKVVPKRDGGKDAYELDDEVSKLVVCDTATWVSNGGGLEIHAKGTGGVETGEVVHLNSEYGRQYHDKLAFWLRQRLAPTERKVLSPDLLRMQATTRRVRQETAETMGVSEGVASARGLSPTIAAFFDTLRPYAEGDEPAPIDVRAVLSGWPDAYDAQSLLAEAEFRELIEEDQEGRLVISTLGRETLPHLYED